MPSMPIYEYICKACSMEFELLLFSDDEPQCPSCSSKDLVRKISKVNFSAGVGGSKNPDSSGGGCSGCSATFCSSCRR